MSAAMRFAYGNCLFAAGVDDPWALFAVQTCSYDLLTRERKRELLLRLLGALHAVEADVQILRVARGVDAERLLLAGGRAAGEPHARARTRYLRAQAEHVGALGVAVPEVFIAVSLRPPAQDVSAFLDGALESDRRRWWGELRRSVALHDRRLLEADELERLRVLADGVHARLADYLEVTPARGADVQWLVRRAYCRGAGEPAVDGRHEPRALVFERNGHAVLVPHEGDVLRWMDGIVEHRGRALRIDSERGTSWQALLVAGALPEQAPFPSTRLELMFAPGESLPFAIDLALCARWLPNALASRLTRRRIQDADQIARAESDGEQGVSDRGHDRTQLARDLLAYLQSASHPPLLRATLSVAVSAAAEDELERRVELCRRAYGEVRLHRPFGDQLALFAQHLPGRRTEVRGYDDILTPEQVAAMAPIAAHAVGSARGFYLGHTLSGSRQPVRFNLREGSDADRNTAILSVGALGTGKTTLDQKLKWEGFLLGARIVDCDPKGDHRFHLLDDVAPHAESVTVRPDAALRGLLDPLRVAPAHLRQDAAVSFLVELLPTRGEAAWEAAIVRAVDAVAGRAREPTCFDVVRALAAGDNIDIEVARTLAVYARSGLTQLGFADPDVNLPALGGRQVTYIAIRDLPAPGPERRRGEYSPAERVGEQLVRLIAMFAMHVLGSERERLKLFSFDEGWRLLGDPVGRQLLASLQRMGRSELAVPIVSTQLVSDRTLGDRESLDNLIGATFVFGMRSEAEAARALALLDLDPDDRALRRRLLEFDRGRCLLRDHRGRVEAVQVELVVPELLAALSTTPAP
jgi:AAA-like domain